jgi:lipopolysaccharide transport system ATP-binding protein
VYGRVGSLLEVGTGFHPELTGRENIYLNGTILGMKRAEIDRKFDEIVGFSGIEKFLDTPVKRYSSGMYVRLAFAVAVHLQSEILLVDEVLAVGDAEFQKKCLGKMGNVVKEGRTILFVSHNMAAVEKLCGKVIWLQTGNMLEAGETRTIITHYLRTLFTSCLERVWELPESAPGNEIARLHAVRVRPSTDTPTDGITMHTPFMIEVEYWNLCPDIYLDVTLHLCTEEGLIAFGTGTLQEPVWHGRPFPKGLFRSICYVPGDLLNSGVHRVNVLVVQNQVSVLFLQEDVLAFDIAEVPDVRGAWYGKLAGVVRPKLQWTTEYKSQ